MAGSDAFARITRDTLKVVAMVPRGRVTTFQSVGNCIAVPARHIAFALSRVVAGLGAKQASIPLHRVVGNNGKLPTQPMDASTRLQEEKIVVLRGYVEAFAALFIDASSLSVDVEASTRPPQYASTGTDFALSDMHGLGPAALRILVAAGITTVAGLRDCDPFLVYATAKRNHSRVNINFLHAIIGAIEDRDWREVARTDRTRILLRLDDLQLLR